MKMGMETFYKSHKDSAPAHEIATYMKKVYSLDAIKKELTNPLNIYHIIKHENIAAGFSKIELTMKHPAIKLERVSKMDQIYLLDSFHGHKLGAKLLSHNIDYSKSRGQNGMWLVVWGIQRQSSFTKNSAFRLSPEINFILPKLTSAPAITCC
jgi:GNAT superfamily N-acetyltransferase